MSFQSFSLELLRENHSIQGASGLCNRFLHPHHCPINMWTGGSNRITLPPDCELRDSFAVFAVCILRNLCVLKPQRFGLPFSRISCLDKLKFSLSLTAIRVSLPPGFYLIPISLHAVSLPGLVFLRSAAFCGLVLSRPCQTRSFAPSIFNTLDSCGQNLRDEKS